MLESQSQSAPPADEERPLINPSVSGPSTHTSTHSRILKQLADRRDALMKEKAAHVLRLAQIQSPVETGRGSVDSSVLSTWMCLGLCWAKAPPLAIALAPIATWYATMASIETQVQNKRNQLNARVSEIDKLLEQSDRVLIPPPAPPSIRM